MAADAEAELDVESDGDSIVASVGDSTVEADWQTMKRLGERILRESDTHKTDLQKAEEINGAHIRVSCECCDYEEEFEYASRVRERGATPEEHADHPDFDCTTDDVKVEAFCPRHGIIPLAYDECDGCADVRNHMNR
jgi:pterin-4a-carbinolamine dehydratase